METTISGHPSSEGCKQVEFYSDIRPMVRWSEGFVPKDNPSGSDLNLSLLEPVRLKQEAPAA